MTFIGELKDLINKHGLDSECNTADYILATYLDACYKAYAAARLGNSIHEEQQPSYTLEQTEVNGTGLRTGTVEFNIQGCPQHTDGKHRFNPINGICPCGIFNPNPT